MPVILAHGGMMQRMTGVSERGRRSIEADDHEAAVPAADGEA